ncbi:iron transporter [Pseudomonas sp.]|uniref:iron transporter n=1 Tax=Pseudomonas sp. TaxID=306 RepID=UPI003A974837
MKAQAFSWSMLSRVLAAIFAGYLFTYAFTAALSQVLPTEPRAAMTIATWPAFVIYPLVILWAFACARVRVVWSGLLLASAVLLIIGFWPQLMRVWS